MTDDDFLAYLDAKRTVDDRALHRPTFDRLTAELEGRATARGDAPVRILEVGCGVGTMLDRLREWDALPVAVEYVGVDVAETNIEEFADRLREGEFRAVGDRQFKFDSDDADTQIDVSLHAADAFEFATEQEAETDDVPAFDLLIGMAFLDIVALDRALDALLPLIDGGGLGYFPITFDGETAFRPVEDADRERRLMAAYHAAMDAPDRPGGSTTGRQLFDRFSAAGINVLAAGGSDWVVTPTIDGYQADEAVFLRHLVETVENALLHEAPASATESVTDTEVSEWAKQRHEQIDRADLGYLAHNVDYLVENP
ncbi:class I SAM-dependent methyltransferase [Halonotius terrestris]|uniref:Class I SAM-dependent methyltransferase n=1 Tax=Halonotius terrestris TaxID=2487750 RepID=A0A8J8P6J9_9EURY|nr:class I SAM-dependent methyltransferase [Halonotius terrestris]TQQ79808.1 class I SAM-dependent methyltransferase [Halonotius terrestris]